jgi:chromosome segregation protein
MRLKKLKLSGFKSFVDPTSVSFPSSLVAVVGPNGCGKSNIIDAVRWVMGESSAKHLRGESMADVIFNGSRNRKALGQASIELVFENDAGRLLGEYASYSEISIKRLVTRDGQSNYYLNGTKCRKKDVTDIFLGTGLGPRSYSIIGQGTISRIIEAKPEELRVFLEEAAGISKYKERRRETENRIKHTEENLSRVLDLREELGKQLDRLKRQANAAEKYKALKEQERLFKAQWHALKWLGLTDQITVLDKQISEKNLRIEALVTEQNRLDIAIEDKRQGFQAANDVVNQVQADYYRIGAEIARLEETIQHQRNRKIQLEQDLSQAKQDWQVAQQHLSNNQSRVEQLAEDIVILEPQVEELKDLYSQGRALLEDTEAKRKDWQGQWDSFIQGSAESSKVAHVEQSKIQQIESSVNTLQQRLEKLQLEQSQLDEAGSQAEVEELSLAVATIEAQHEESTEQHELLVEQLKTQKQELHQIEEAYHQLRSEAQQLKAKEASLVQMQQVALGKEDKAEQKWLAKHKLDKAQRLAELIQVESGYETALEIALGDRLQALCVDDISKLESAITELDAGCVNLIQSDSTLTAGVVDPAKPPLYKKIKTQHPICQNLLTGVYVANDLTEALSWLNDIAKHESIVTLDGIVLGVGWCRIIREQDERRGVIAREKAIQELQQQITAQDSLIEEKRDVIEQLKTTIEAGETQKDDLNQSRNELFSALSDKRSQVQVKKNKIEQVLSRRQAIEEEMALELERRETFEQQLLEARDSWQQAMEAMELDAERREQLMQTQEEIGAALEKHREESHQTRQSLHDKELSLKTKQSEQHNLQVSIERDQSQVDVLSERIEALTISQQEMQIDDDASPETMLEDRLKAHEVAEQNLNNEKQKLEQLKITLTDDEKSRNQYVESIRTEQTQLDAIRMERQTLLVRRQTIEETLAETEQELKPLLDNMPEAANESQWEEELKTIAIKIQRLGAINLAAIDEYEIESERKRYLDEQHDDLTTALETLVEAIRKIDKETRTRFKETYDQVNEGFQKLFPRLFGGGQAYLDLTGDDLLDTGVTVMARPPGKRNSTIHLLSGGEKALTAVALVFAIFQLNPSPFCMLDEVDAPLDDANVTRFCALVKDMAQHVQFIFITHNKVAMELAEQLLGVTMHEPGVSRVVSVDVEEAIAIAG